MCDARVDAAKSCVAKMLYGGAMMRTRAFYSARSHFGHACKRVYIQFVCVCVCVF